jgi:type IV secretory pathway VirB10-like protein
MNRFLATTAVALLLGAAPGLAQTPASPNAAQQPPMQAPMQPEPPSAIPSETSPKSLDQSSEAAKPIAPDQSTEAAKPIAPEQSAQFLTEQKPDELLASKLIGKPAVNSQDETIGNVNDFVTDRSGKVIGALIGVGGFLGIGEKHVAVRFEDLKFTRDDNDNVKVTLNISKEMLASAPAYKTVEEQPVVEGSAKTDREDNTRTY